MPAMKTWAPTSAWAWDPRSKSLSGLPSRGREGIDLLQRRRQFEHRVVAVVVERVTDAGLATADRDELVRAAVDNAWRCPDTSLASGGPVNDDGLGAVQRLPDDSALIGATVAGESAEGHVDPVRARHQRAALTGGRGR